MLIGLDVGGTHTDVVLLSPEGVDREFKIRTDPADLFNTVLTGLEKITEGIDPGTIQRAVFSTTLTTNAIVQKKIPQVAMIVSGGPGINPQFFMTNTHFFCVAGSIDHRGREREPVDTDEIANIAEFLKKGGIRHVGVVGKFSVRNPAHELEIAQALTGSVDKIFLGHQCSGSLNFPRRIATTFLNAATYPIHKEFFDSVKKSLEKKGLRVPIHILKADGGTMSLEASIEFPSQTIFSGPAASVMGSLSFAPSKGDTLVMDIGGTTTDMAILVDGVPVLNPAGITLGAYKTLIRSLETHSIGLGGDSRVRFSGGKLHIGPERAGPAMAYGGAHPTPTDALFALGVVTDGDVARAREGIGSIAAAMGVPPEQAARQIFDQTCRKILKEAQKLIARINSKPVYTVHELQEGFKVRPRTVLIVGGPAPYFAKRLEELSKYEVRVVPGWKVANAVGTALARTTCEVTLFADTEQGIATAPEENFSLRIGGSFSQADAQAKALELLRHKAVQKGAEIDDLEMEVIESLQFNMVRGFNTTGRNIRVKVQVRPGLLHGYSALPLKLSAGAG